MDVNATLAILAMLCALMGACILTWKDQFAAALGQIGAAMYGGRGQDNEATIRKFTGVELWFWAGVMFLLAAWLGFRSAG